MIITFCGHAEFYSAKSLETVLINILESNIGKQSAIFYLGGYGHFDEFARKTCKAFKNSHSKATSYFVTPYLDEKYLKNKDIDIYYDGVLLPDIEKVPKRFRIIERNKWMVRNADLVIAYVKYDWGGASQMLNYAKKLNKKIINLADFEI